MISLNFKQLIAMGYCVALIAVAAAQDGNLTPPPDGVNARTALADIQGKVDKIQTVKATLEFDRKDEDEKKKKKKKKNNTQNPNPAWPEPPGRDVERGPLVISRGVGARVTLVRKEEKADYVSNSTTLWKYDVDDKEAQRIPANWPVIDTFVSNALKINVFVAMDEDSIRLKGSESVDGVPCWVLEGNSPSRLEMVGVDSVKLKLWVAKTDGIPRIIKVPSEKDTIIRLKGIQLNQPVDASQFQFTPPESVETKNILGF